MSSDATPPASLLAQTLLPVVELEPESTVIRRANPAGAALFGLAAGALGARPLTDFAAPSARPALAAWLASRGPEAPRTEPLGSTDHDRRPVRLYQLGHAPSGQLVALEPLAPPDRTATPEQPAALPAAIFRHIVLSANEGVWIVDANQHTIFVNQRMADMLGFTPEEMQSRPLTDFISAGELADHQAQVSRRRRGLADRYERNLRRKDGATLCVFSSITAIMDAGGGYQGAFGLFTDITERKRTERALHLNEERYRSLLAAATDYVFTVAYADGRPGRTTHGAGCIKVTGYEPADYEADPFLWYRMVAIEDRAAVEQHIQRANQGPGADTLEHRLIHRDGSVRWVRSTLVPRRDHTGTLRAVDGLVTDITERRLVLAQLRERETLYRAVMESAADGFWIIDPAGKLLEVNEAYARRSGYSRAELLTLRVTDLEAAETPEETATHLQQIVRAGSTLFETRHRTKDGTVWQVEVSTSYWAIGTGRLFVFIRDIQRRKRSEALLRTRLQLSELSRHGELDPLLQAALDTAELITGSSIGFFHFVDPDQEHLTLQTWSTGTIRHFCTAEGKGRHYPLSTAGIWTDCVRQRTPVIHNDYASAPGRRGLPPGHAQVLRELTVPILRDGRVVAIIGVGNKTTDYVPDDVESVLGLADVAMDFVLRVQAEQQLRRNEHQLRLIIDAVPALIAYVDPDFRYRLFNEMYHTWFGDPAEVVARRTIAEQLGEAAWREVGPLMKRAMAGEALSFEKELNLRAVGHRWIHGSYTPDRGPDGQTRGIVILAQDVTPQKELEAQLLRAQRLEVVGRLASGVAHDLNNILQPVLMAPRLLRPALTDPDSLALLDMVESSVRRGAAIIKQLLAFGRGTEARRLPLRLDTLLHEITQILRGTLPKNIALRCELPPSPHLVEADVTQLHQVLMNLCVNARDAMRAGGTLTLHLGSVSLAHPLPDAIPDGRTGPFQVISVIDTGTGIEPENLPRLFDPFFTTKDVGEGSGLGLPTVLGIVRSHEGFLQVSSTPGKGSTFRVFLPESAAAAVAAQPAAPPPAVIDGQSRHVLVVDDEEAVRTLLRQSLQQHHFRVSEAANGAEALAFLGLQDEAVDLVITDLLMPVMDGTDLIAELHRRRPLLPLIAMSGTVASGQAPAALRPAIRTLLPKPFDTAQLTAALRLALPSL